jgi:hypothetical protein
MAPDSDDFETTVAETRSHAAEFLGLAEAEAIVLAEQLGLELRVIRSDQDGVTMDLRARRMTIDVREGPVTDAFGG